MHEDLNRHDEITVGSERAFGVVFAVVFVVVALWPLLDGAAPHWWALAVAAAFLAAPITSLTPVIGAGYVTAFVQTYFKPPLVSELKEVARDIGAFRGWWRNRLLRIFLVFVLTTLGSIFGTWVGGAEIVSNLF